MDSEFKTLLYYLNYLHYYYEALVYRKLSCFKIEILIAIAKRAEDTVRTTALSKDVGIPLKRLTPVLKSLSHDSILRIEGGKVSFQDIALKYWLLKESCTEKLQREFDRNRSILIEVWRAYNSIRQGMDPKRKEELLLTGSL